MSVLLILRSVNEDQASALRKGIISAGDLITSKSASYDGSGDITHLGCGCLLTLVVILTIFVPASNMFGWKIAIILASIFEVFPIYFAWYIRNRSRRKVDLKAIDPLTVIPNDNELCLYHWHALNYLLTGSNEEGFSPENFLINGGDLLPKSSIMSEYGPPRIITPRELPAIREVLERVNLSDAAVRLEQASEKLAIHLGRFEKESLESEFQHLDQFIETANISGASVVVEMC